MRVEELLRSLPNGLHDAELLAVTASPSGTALELDLQIWVGDLEAEDPERREAYRGATITLSDLHLWTGSFAHLAEGADIIDVGPLACLDGPGQPPSLPPCPDPIHWIYSSRRNELGFFSAARADLVWLDS